MLSYTFRTPGFGMLPLCFPTQLWTLWGQKPYFRLHDIPSHPPPNTSRTHQRPTSPPGASKGHSHNAAALWWDSLCPAHPRGRALERNPYTARLCPHIQRQSLKTATILSLCLPQSRSLELKETLDTTDISFHKCVNRGHRREVTSSPLTHPRKSILKETPSSKGPQMCYCRYAMVPRWEWKWFQILCCFWQVK